MPPDLQGCGITVTTPPPPRSKKKQGLLYKVQGIHETFHGVKIYKIIHDSWTTETNISTKVTFALELLMYAGNWEKKP